MERRTELYVGTLRKFIEAMNGELVIAARFADGVEVPIRPQRRKTPLDRSPAGRETALLRGTIEINNITVVQGAAARVRTA
jgi:hypothetical protein